MAACAKCKDLVRPIFVAGVLKYKSNGCGEVYPVENEGTLVIDDDEQSIFTSQSGRVIASYPINSVAMDPKDPTKPLVCPHCNKATNMVRYNILDNRKRYGCMCGKVWWQDEAN